MNCKYYTPEIEEFHVGFEYEQHEIINERDPHWKMMVKKMGFSTKEINQMFYNVDLVDNLDQKRIRVKYLDSSDIESLGFKLKVENKYRITFANRLYSIVYSKMKSNHLEIFLIQPYVNEYDGLKFSGVIKNKSELKKLLIQLEIINE
jgi:hypothetical protein